MDSKSYETNLKEVGSDPNFFESSKRQDTSRRKGEKTKKDEGTVKIMDDESDELVTIGKSICGRWIKYQLKLGEGGYKYVFKAYDCEKGFHVAWCEFKKHHVATKEKQVNMIKEIEIMVKMDHPNIVQCYDVFDEYTDLTVANTPTNIKTIILIQELMGEGTLKSVIRKNFINGKLILKFQLITFWLHQIIDAMTYMHDKLNPPIIHRDLKADNIFLESNSLDKYLNVKVGDFGLAKQMDKKENHTMLGTVGFMAPEVYDEKYDDKADIYAFGMLMLETFTNRSPYDECETVMQVAKKTMSGKHPDIFQLISDSSLREMIACCIHPLPDYRPKASQLYYHPLFLTHYESESKNILPVEITPNIDNNTDRETTMEKFVENLVDSNGKFETNLNLRMKFRNRRIQMAFNLDEGESLEFDLDVYKLNDVDDLIGNLRSEFQEGMIQALNFNKNIDEKIINVQLERIFKSMELQLYYLKNVALGKRWYFIFNRSLSTLNEAELNQDVTGFSLLAMYKRNWQEASNTLSSEQQQYQAKINKAEEKLKRIAKGHKNPDNSSTPTGLASSVTPPIPLTPPVAVTSIPNDTVNLSTTLSTGSAVPIAVASNPNSQNIHIVSSSTDVPNKRSMESNKNDKPKNSIHSQSQQKIKKNTTDTTHDYRLDSYSTFFPGAGSPQHQQSYHHANSIISNFNYPSPIHSFQQSPFVVQPQWPMPFVWNSTLLPQGMSQVMPQGMSQGMLQGMSQGMPQGMSHGMPHGIPQGMSQGLSHGMSQVIPQGIPPGIVQAMPPSLGSGQMSFSVMPTNTPQTQKSHNVESENLGLNETSKGRTQTDTQLQSRSRLSETLANNKFYTHEQVLRIISMKAQRKSRDAFMVIPITDQRKSQGSQSNAPQYPSQQLFRIVKVKELGKTTEAKEAINSGLPLNDIKAKIDSSISLGSDLSDTLSMRTGLISTPYGISQGGMAMELPRQNIYPNMPQMPSYMSYQPFMSQQMHSVPYYWYPPVHPLHPQSQYQLQMPGHPAYSNANMYSAFRFPTESMDGNNIHQSHELNRSSINHPLPPTKSRLDSINKFIVQTIPETLTQKRTISDAASLLDDGEIINDMIDNRMKIKDNKQLDRIPPIREFPTTTSTTTKTLKNEVSEMKSANIHEDISFNMKFNDNGMPDQPTLETVDSCHKGYCKDDSDVEAPEEANTCANSLVKNKIQPELTSSSSSSTSSVLSIRMHSPKQQKNCEPDSFIEAKAIYSATAAALANVHLLTSSKYANSGLTAATRPYHSIVFSNRASVISHTNHNKSHSMKLDFQRNSSSN